MNNKGEHRPQREEKSMKRRTFLTAAGAAIAGLQFPIRIASAQEKVIRFAMPQDFTRTRASSGPGTGIGRSSNTRRCTSRKTAVNI